MENIFNNKTVVSELDRLHSLIGTDGDRDVEYDISILKNALSIIEEKIFNNNEDYAICELNMWYECHNSLDNILNVLGLDVDIEKSEFDYYQFCIVKSNQ